MGRYRRFLTVGTYGTVGFRVKLRTSGYLTYGTYGTVPAISPKFYLSFTILVSFILVKYPDRIGLLRYLRYRRYLGTYGTYGTVGSEYGTVGTVVPLSEPSEPSGPSTSFGVDRVADVAQTNARQVLASSFRLTQEVLLHSRKSRAG